jgi:hypothetical protein
MSSFKTLLIEDSRIADITDSEVFGVLSGASQSTYQQYNAVSASNSSIVFATQIPSENIVIDRRLLINSTVNFTITAGGAGRIPPIGQAVFAYGYKDSLQQFPLNSLFTTCQTTINNVSTSSNLKDIMPMLMVMNDSRVMSRWNSTAPALRDQAYGFYPDALGATNNPLASYGVSSYDNDFVPRGAYAFRIVSVIHTAGGGVNDGSLISTGNADAWSIVCSYNTTEPFLALSPFINFGSDNSAGLLGVNTMSFVLNIDNACSRMFSSAGGSFTNGGTTAATWLPYISSIALGGVGLNPFTDTRLLFNFLSLQPEQYAKLSTKNVVSYHDYPRFLTIQNNQANINAAIYPTPAFAASGVVLAGPTIATSTLTSQAIQLNQIPDLILICARIPMSSQDWSDASAFLTINNIRLNFNNSSGLLASATQQDLYEMSVRNGSAQSYYEFSGLSQNNDQTTGLVKYIPTTGSVLVINPSLDLSLPSYLTASSLGQFQLQFNLQVSNQFPFLVNPEICVICVNSGIFVTTQGTSAIYTGILTKDETLRTKTEKAVADIDTRSFERLVGGSMINRGVASVGAKLRRHGMVGMSGSGKSGGGSGGEVASALPNEMLGSGSGGLGGKKGRNSKVQKYL